MALVFRLLTYDRYLPYMDFNEESNMYLLARHWRGVEVVPVIPEWLAGYPPLYVWINMGVQSLVEALRSKPWVLPGDYINVLRLLAVLIGVITTTFIVSIGWQLGGPVAGWFAGLVWAISPIIVEHNNIALADPFIYFYTALVTAVSLRAWHTSNPRWLIVGAIAIILGVYTKYSVVYLTIPWLFANIVLLRRDFKTTLPWVMIQVFLAVVSAIYLIGVYGALGLDNMEAEQIRESGLEEILSLSPVFNNLYYTIYPITVPLFVGVMLAGAVSYIYNARQKLRLVNGRWLVVLALMAVLGVMLSASFRTVDDTLLKMRHTLPLSIALIAIWASAIVQVVFTLQGLSSSIRRWGVVVIVGGLTLLFLGMNAPRLVAMIDAFAKTDTRVVLWQWADVNIPLDGHILVRENGPLGKVWNRPWGGYDGVKPFDWRFVTAQQLEEGDPFEFAMSANIGYFAATNQDMATRFNTEGTDRFIGQLTPVKTIFPAEGQSGPTIFFYRVLPPQQTADVIFGDQIQLVGYDLSAESVSAGDTLTFRPYWRALRLPDTNYSMFIHVMSSESDAILAQYDGAPTTPQRLTLTWDDPDELYIGSDVRLTIPEGTAPGDYRIAIGLYDFVTGARLQTQAGAEFFAIPLDVQQ